MQLILLRVQMLLCRSPRWIAAGTLLISTAFAQSQPGRPYLDGNPADRVVNPLPFPVAVLIEHAREDGSIDSRSVVVVETRSSNNVQVPSGSAARTFEPLAPVGLTRAPSCGQSPTAMPLTREQTEQTIQKLDAATLDSPEAQAVIAKVAEQAQVEMEQRFDEANVRRHDPLAAELRFEQFRDADLATKQKMIQEDHQQKISDAIEDVMFISAAYADTAVQKEEQARKEADLLAQMLKDKADFLQRIDSDFAAMSARVDANQQLLSVATAELAKRVPATGAVEIAPSTPIVRACSGAGDVRDQAIFQWDAPANVRVLLGKAAFDKGGEEPIIFRRVLRTPQWVASFYWPMNAREAKFEVGQSSSNWISLSGRIDPGRPAVSQEVKEAKKAVTALKRRYKDASFSADGGDDTRTAILP